jgi:hypothetical protein
MFMLFGQSIICGALLVAFFYADIHNLQTDVTQDWEKQKERSLDCEVIDQHSIWVQNGNRRHVPEEPHAADEVHERKDTDGYKIARVVVGKRPALFL